MTDAKQQLLRFLEQKAFDPVMRAKPEGRSEADKRKLEHVQRATASEIERYRAYASAEELVTNFKRDLHSRPAKKIHAELRSLNLPTIEDTREEFETRARDLGLGASS